MTRPHDPRTTELFQQALEQNTGETISLEQFIAPLETRAYGFLVVLLSLPNFIPIPMGVGGICGTLLVLIGAQMLWGMPRPWLPQFARQHGFPRRSVETFVAHMAPMFNRLERVCRPRLEQITRKPWSHFSGLVLILLGILLALPIPFTNYPFGLLIMGFGVALIERDGGLLSLTWGATIASAAMVGSLSRAMVALVQHFIG
ncbi:MAG: exopolysaccharide biosynthesis protein [Rhodanobacteraceae bacterium]|nr:exopolysaccharide biosynthesis protein [Rhodanobacteraceae bacterium]